MKTKLFLCICLALIGVIFFSCKENLLENNEYGKASNELTIDEAQTLLKNFRECDVQTKSTISFQINKVQKHYYPIDNRETKSSISSLTEDAIPVYEFSTKENGREGFALVLADKRIQNVLAYSSYGNLNDTVFNLGLKYFVRSIPEHIKYSLDKYEKAPESKETKSSVEENVTYHYCEIPVKWGQEYPFNMYVPCSCDDLPQKYHGRAPAGCVAVAVAQVLAYHARPQIRFRWNLLLSSQYISEKSPDNVKREVGEMMHDIGEKVDMSYDCSGSGSYISKTQFAFAEYGYIYDLIKYYDTIGIVESIDNDCPVLLSGATSRNEGHLWVVDGRRKATVDNKEQTWLMMNWGWNGINDGWFFCYDPAVFDSGNYEFNKNLTYMGNIKYNGVD